MTLPTAAEVAFAKSVGIDAMDVARAREVINGIAALPWPREVRLAVLVRLAQMANADVGVALGGLSLDAAPVVSFEELLSIHGLDAFRVTGLARGLSRIAPESLTGPLEQVSSLKSVIEGLKAENAALRNQVNALKVQSLDGASEPQVMPLAEAAASIGNQLAELDDAMRASNIGLRIAASQISFRAVATKVGKELAFDFNAPSSGSSAVALQFVNKQAPSEADSAPVGVPNVVGYSPSLAQRKLESVALLASFAKSGRTKTGQVASQSPSAGSTVPRGTLVRLVVG